MSALAGSVGAAGAAGSCLRYSRTLNLEVGAAVEEEAGFGVEGGLGGGLDVVSGVEVLDLMINIQITKKYN